MQLANTVALLFITSLQNSDAGVFRLHATQPLVPADKSHELVYPTSNQSNLGKFIDASPKIKIRSAATRDVSRQSSGTSSERTEVLDVECFQSFPGPGRSSRCPEACPYMRFDPDAMCHFKCITKEWCLTAPNMPTSFADDEDGQCRVCSVPGCRKCLAPTQCVEGECMEGFDMVDGACKPRSRNIWRAIFCVLGVLALVALSYLAVLWHRPIRQSMKLKLAQKYRSMSKLRRNCKGHPFYNLNTNLCKEPISGIGALLHFRFQFFWLAWAFIVLVLTGLVSYYHGRFKASDTLAATPTHEEVFKQCSKFDTDNAYQVYMIQKNFERLTGVIYVATTLAVIGFSIRQRIAYKVQEEKTVNMEDFALCVYHMPIEKARDSLEDDYLEFFQSKWNGVIGVTICWDYAEEETKVIDAVTKQMHEKFDKEYNRHLLTAQEMEMLQNEDEAALDSIASYRKKRESCCVGPELRCLDDAVLGTAQASDAGDHFDATEENIKELLSGLSTTGYVFVVFETEERQKEALHIYDEAKRGTPITYKEKTLDVAREPLDPMTVNWTGFSIHKRDRNKNILRGIFITLGVIFLWAVCFYGPYVVYIISWSQVAGQTTGDATTMQLLGLMCAVGNQVVYFTCAKVADNAGFRNRDYANTFNCCLYTFAVLINIIVDVSLMIIMAHGYQQDSGMDPAAAIRNPSFSYSLFVQLVGYLYPCTLLVPYLAEPFPMNIIPYFLGKWMVRSAIKISRHKAEQALVCPEFDLLRYGDILINVSTVIICFFLASSSLWWIFLWLFVSNGIIYLWDHYRFLRQCEELYFANDQMERCSQYISALPCGLLAAAYVFKRYEGRQLLKSFEDVNHGISNSLWVMVIGTFILHIIIHTLVNVFLVPRFLPADGDPSTKPYSECAAETPCCWFKSNPVHCLRSLNLKGHSPPHMFYMKGKEYLHKQHLRIHQYYEEPSFDLDDGIGGSLRDIQKAFRAKFTYKRTATASKLGCVGTPSEGTEHLDDDRVEEGSCHTQ